MPLYPCKTKNITLIRILNYTVFLNTNPFKLHMPILVYRFRVFLNKWQKAPQVHCEYILYLEGNARL